MTRANSFIVVILMLLTNVSVGQSIDVEKDRFFGTKKLVVKAYNGCCAKKGFSNVYYFDSSGRTVRLSYFYKRELRAEFLYNYNDRGLMTEEIKIFDVSRKSKMDTTRYLYSYDDKDRVLTKTTYLGNFTSTETYSDFDDSNNAQTVVRVVLKNYTYIDQRKYDSNGKLIEEQRLHDGIVTHREEMDYNKEGDKVVSNIPTLEEHKTGNEVVLVGGNRHAILERYEYTYDRKGRWKEKYVVFDDKRVLLEKRFYQ